MCEPFARSKAIDHDHETEPEPDELIIVETDRSHANYDARLAELLHAVEQEEAWGARMPFPRTHKIPPEVLAADYRILHIEPSAEPRWHFQLSLPRSARIATTVAPTTDHAMPCTTLASIQLVQRQASIDVLGLSWNDRSDVAGWLDEWLEQLSMQPFSSRPRRTEHGVMGDILAISRRRDHDVVARYRTARFGDRLFVIVLRAPLFSYRLAARDFVLAAATLTPHA